ncbi:MAG: twin-arginine translocation pathway signal protein [Acetobacteraceae bacterium]|nr:twin-arginine translocation pathway signal protein [Acetobacteraceae bacterium]
MPARRALLLAAGSAALPRPAVAQDPAWPSRPIRVIAPYSPGGQSDTVIRMLAPKMQELLGQPIVVENRTGAGGTIGAGLVAQAPADGHTLLFESFSFVVVPLIAKGLGFDYETAFVPVAQAVTLPYVLVVKRDFPPPHDLAGFVAEARRRPGITYGTPGVGTPGHLAGALLAHRAGIRLEHVPYRGGQDAARDVIAGNIDAAISTANTLRPLVEDGRAHGIALTSAERRGSLARLPTIAESGYPGFDITSWNGLFAPAGTPAPVVARLNAAVRHGTTDAEIVRRLALTGNEAVSAEAAAFAARIARDRETVRRIVAEAGIRID